MHLAPRESDRVPLRPLLPALSHLVSIPRETCVFGESRHECGRVAAGHDQISEMGELATHLPGNALLTDARYLPIQAAGVNLYGPSLSEWLP